MNVLGLCDSHDSGACLFVDGNLVAAVNEERINRVKLWRGFPAGSIAEVLRIGGVRPDKIDRVVVGSRTTPNLIARVLRDKYPRLKETQGQFGYLHNLVISWEALTRKVPPIERAEAAAAQAIFRRELATVDVRAPIAMVDHHTAHAASAWATSPSDRALVVTLDGLGDGLSLTVSVGERGRKLTRVYEETGFSAQTLYYSRLTEFLGFRAIRDEGKVNGLAAYTPETPALDLARALLHVRDGRFNSQNHLRPTSVKAWPFSELRRFTREQIAASFQRNMEEQVCAFLRYWLARTGTRHIAAAGGAFANVKLNQRVASLDEVDGFYVFPHMGDGGLAVGGVYAYLEQDPKPLPHVYFGEVPAEDDVRKALGPTSLRWEQKADIAGEVARLLAEGEVVARFEGPMEFGPRALGHRSILAPGRSTEITALLNEHLRRSDFMPFAPAILEEDFDGAFTGGAKARHAAHFMTVSFDALPSMHQQCPAAVHVDGTCRPQAVNEQASPDFARILREYKARTGVPAIINTSFNMHEEPIVHRPEDAVASFLRSGLRYLAIGNFLAQRSQADAGAFRKLAS
jgi:carbamoyltransferase